MSPSAAIRLGAPRSSPGTREPSCVQNSLSAEPPRLLPTSQATEAGPECQHPKGHCTTSQVKSACGAVNFESGPKALMALGADIIGNVSAAPAVSIHGCKINFVLCWLGVVLSSLYPIVCTMAWREYEGCQSSVQW